MKDSLFKSVVLARTCTFKELKELLQKANREALVARTNKHFGIGKTTSRRNTKKESTYGMYKSLINTITQAKQIKEIWTMEEVDEYLMGCSYKELVERKAIIIKELI